MEGRYKQYGNFNIYIMKNTYTIGRDEGCDIVITDSTDVVSRLHATIRVESRDKIFLIDQSRNGTYVNGMKMSSNVEIPVSRDDVVSFAHVYNLDWSLVPMPKNNTLKIILILFVFIALTAGLTYAAILYFDKPEALSSSGQETAAMEEPAKEPATEPLVLDSLKEKSNVDSLAINNDSIMGDTVKLNATENSSLSKSPVQTPKRVVEAEKNNETGDVKTEEVWTPLY